jgi:ribosomal protein S18 acetylase RimI-like enzyme
MKLTIRNGNLNDIQKVEYWDWLNQNILEWKLRNNEIFIAELEEGIIGYLRLEYLWTKFPYIGLISVNEDYRRQGIGSALLTFLEDYLYTTGHVTLFSSSQVNEVEPQIWHRRMGFEECGIINGINERNIGELFFKKTIKNQLQ